MLLAHFKRVKLVFSVKTDFRYKKPFITVLFSSIHLRFLDSKGFLARELTTLEFTIPNLVTQALLAQPRRYQFWKAMGTP